MSHPLEEYFSYQGTGSEGLDTNPQSGHPLAQYFTDKKDISPQERTSPGIRGQLERKVVSPAVEFLTKAVTSIPEAGKSLSKLGLQGVNALLNKFGIGVSPEEFEKINKTIQSAGPFGQFPDESEISKGIKDITGGKLEPSTSGERILKNAAGLAGSVAGFGPSAALGSPLNALATTAFAGTTAGLEESGAHPALALGGGILADVLTRSGANLASKVAGIFKKGVPKSAGEISGKLSRIKPEDVKNEVIAAGERLGISKGEIPISAQVSTPAIRSIETKLRESSLSGKHLERQLQNVESKTRNAYEDISNQISSRQNLLPGAVSEEAIAQLKNAEIDSEKIYQSFYKQAEKTLPQDAHIEAKTGQKLYQMLDSTIKKLSGGSGNPAKDTVVTRLKRLKNDWETRFPEGRVPVRDVVEQKKDFNQIIKYETKGGADKILKPLNHFTKNAIQDYGLTNRPFLSRFNQAESRFGKSAQEFRKNNSVKSLLETQNPQQILNKMRNVRTYRELKKIFERTPEGKEAFADLSKYLLEDIIGAKLLNKEGKVSWGNASGVFKNPKNREIAQEIVGKENFNKLKDISKFSFGIEEGLRKFANSSGTATKGLDIALILGTLGKGFGQIFTGDVIRGSKNISLILTPRIMARLMANPEFIEAVTQVAHAAKGKDPNVFFEAAKRASKYAISEIANENSEQEKE